VRVDLELDQTESVEPFRIGNRHMVGRTAGRTGQIGASTPADERNPITNPRGNRLKQAATPAFAQKMKGVTAANHNYLSRCYGIARLRWDRSCLDRDGSFGKNRTDLLCVRFPGIGGRGKRYE